jgi:uncharacterized protein
MKIKRHLSSLLTSLNDRTLLLFTGARQTGKTTLVREFFPQLPYYNLDAIEYREQLMNISSFKWNQDVGPAILDEIQKQPELFDKIKYSFDEGELHFSVLTGSSQILLMKNIKESLAGRVSVVEVFPFMLSELTDPEGIISGNPLLDWVLSLEKIDDFLDQFPTVVLGSLWEDLKSREDYLLKWGGMPALIHLQDEKRRIRWISDYSRTYLEKDLSDLARLTEIHSFAKFQQLSALRSANLLSYSNLARDTGIATETARRYMEYLRMSYQALLLPPFDKNLTSSTIHTPKIYWIDNGLMRYTSGIGFELDNGQLYENYIASELYKWVKTHGSDVKLSFYRTRSGMEVDFMIETHTGLIAIEAKSRETVSSSDFTALRRLAAAAGDTLKAGIVVYRGNKILSFGKKLWAVPSCRLFGEKYGQVL